MRTVPLAWVTEEIKYTMHIKHLAQNHTPCGSDGKESACSKGDLGSIPGLGRSLGEGNGNALQDSCLENSMDRERLACYKFMGSQRVRHD